MVARQVLPAAVYGAAVVARSRKGSAPHPAHRSAAAAHAAALALGTVVAGVAAYGYIALGTRTYGAEDFAPIAVIWSGSAVSRIK